MKRFIRYFIITFILVIFTACSSKKHAEIPLYQYAKFNNLDGVIFASKNQAIDTPSPFNKFTSVHYAVENGNLKMLEHLIDKGANIEARSKDGDTPLIRAAYRGDLQIVNYLISKGADLDAQSKLGITPLITSAGFDRLNIIKALVEAGANIEFISSRGYSAIKVAKAKNNDRIVYYLRLVQIKRENKKYKEKN